MRDDEITDGQDERLRDVALDMDRGAVALQLRWVPVASDRQDQIERFIPQVVEDGGEDTRRVIERRPERGEDGRLCR